MEQRKWTTADDEHLVAAWSKEPVSTIAAALDRTQLSVWTRASRLNLVGAAPPVRRVEWRDAR